MVDRDRAQGRSVGAAPAAVEASFRNTESHDTPVRHPPLAAALPGAALDRRGWGELFPIEESNSDGETRKLQGYALDQLLVASLEGPAGSCPERAHDPSLEFAEASWPDDLALEDHPALVDDDDEDVVTQAGPLRPTAPPGPPEREAPPSTDDAATEPDPTPPAAAPLPPPELPMSRGELPSAPGSSNPWGNEPARPASSPSLGAEPSPGPEPPEAPPQNGPSLAVKIVVFTGMAALGGGLAALLYAHPPSAPPAAPPAPAASSAAAISSTPPPPSAASAPAPEPPPSAAPSALPSALPSTLPSASAAAPTDGAASTDDTAALEALGQLREGIGTCVREVGSLPGSSPAVPRLLTMTRAPGFITLRPDWSTAVWGCARFRLSAPMRFQIQWQVVKLNVEGIGVAWIDHDGDGTPDRAFAFHAVAGANKGELQLGEIASIEPSHPVIPVY